MPRNFLEGQVFSWKENSYKLMISLFWLLKKLEKPFFFGRTLIIYGKKQK